MYKRQHKTTRCCSASLTICFSVFRPYEVQQHVVTGTTSLAHHARLEATSLAASATAHWIQTGSFGVQSDEWPVSTIFGGRLPAYLYCRPTTTSIVQRWGSRNSHKSGWSLIHCCWTASLQQPSSPSVHGFWT